MNLRKLSVPTKRLIWRMSARVPMGEWIERGPRKPAPVRPVPDEAVDSGSGGRLLSSVELFGGTEISDDPDTVPGRFFNDMLSSFDAAPQRADGFWESSSFDLLSGADVIESADPVPADVFDELFAPEHGRGKAPR